MAVAVHAPRINNNDDIVKLISESVAVGDRVTRGQVLAQVETDKAVVDVSAPADGYVLGFVARIDESVSVGSVLIWLGETADEAMPQLRLAGSAGSSEASAPGGLTAKARVLLRRHGLTADSVQRAGERLTAQDVERHVASRGTPTAATVPAPYSAARQSTPDVPGELRELLSDERGMAHTVCWSRDFAVPGYIEMEYDTQAWDGYAKAFADRHRLMMSPLLALMAWRLVQLARESATLNSTIIGDQRYQYSPINLGFTVQAGETLYLTVVRDAGSMDETRFVHAMGDVMKRATGRKLAPEEMRGATISFSSMSRWKVSRHIPVLPPQTALIVAHAMSASGVSTLGATYDHRVLNGFQVVNLLRHLGRPAAAAGNKVQ